MYEKLKSIVFNLNSENELGLLILLVSQINNSIVQK